MRLTKTIPIEGDALTADLMERLALGETITAHCESLSDKDRARQNAYWVKRTKPRADGNEYRITCSNSNETVTVTVIKSE